MSNIHTRITKATDSGAVPNSLGKLASLAGAAIAAALFLGAPIIEPAAPMLASAGAIPDTDSDDDRDRLPTTSDIFFGCNPEVFDTDGDKASDGQEVIDMKTKCNNPDTDGDGITDGPEVNFYKTDPLDPQSKPIDRRPPPEPVPDAPPDPAPAEPGRPNDRDSDGLFNDDEINVYGTNPDVADTDGDGPDDGQEVYDGTNPLDKNDHL